MIRALVAVALLSLAACADSRLIKPSADEAASLGIRAESAERLEVTLHRRIVAGGPGSWVQAAAWDEYTVTVENRGGEPIAIDAIVLASEGLPEASHSTRRENLESESVRNVEAFKNGALAGVVGAAASTTVMTAALMSAGWTVVTPAAPIALLAGGALALNHMRQRSKDATVIDHQLMRRGLSVPAMLAADARLDGSAFFPISPTARQMIVRYWSDGAERELFLDLDALPPRAIPQPEKG